ncbi:hypothetical protein OFN55_13610, partial [Escherichia coli]|nr:hypothetical protein [Escherichia coli]
SAQIREILISESAWEEMTCLFAPSLTPFPLLECREIILKNMIYHAYKIRKSKMSKIRKT